MPRESCRPESLAQVRREIESVDRSIVLLVAARLDAARRALRLRVTHGHRMTDGAQERRVLERSREWALELGLPERLVQSLFSTLIEEGKARFRSSEAAADPEVVTVLLAAPAGPEVRLRGAPSLQLVAIPPSR
jgi:chorismate mutase